MVDIATFVINAAEGTYRLYVPYPAGSQILRYEPTADGSGFSAPGPYFLRQQRAGRRRSSRSSSTATCTPSRATRPDQVLQRQPHRLLARPAPDDKNLRPGHAYGLIDATGNKGNGQLFIWDSQWQRILVYNKTDGTYVEQYLAADGAPPLSDLTGMYIVDRGVTQPPILVWARPDGLYQAPLTGHRHRAALAGRVRAAVDAAVDRTVAPAIADGPSDAAAAERDTGPAERQPTERPRRTPRAVSSAEPSASALSTSRIRPCPQGAPERRQRRGNGALNEMVVESVRVHMMSSQHVVILRDTAHDRYLPIWIGPWEANAIAMRLQGVTPERPMTHDLF